MLPKIPASKAQVHSLESLCGTCNKGMIKLFEEEIDQLMAQMIFACQHDGVVNLVGPGAEEGQDRLSTPTPG